MTQPEDLLQRVLDTAKRHGATAADALMVSGHSSSVRVRLGETEEVTQSRDKGVGLRVFVGDRSATTSTSDLRPEALDALIARVVEAAKVTASDPFAGLPDIAGYEGGTPATDLELYDPDIGTMSADRALEMARACEAAALDVDPRLTNSEGSQLGWGESTYHFANTHGILHARKGSSASLWTTPVGEDNGQKQRDSWWTSARHLSDLDAAEAIGQEAARRTLRRLGARKPKTCQVPVVFEAPIASRLIGTLIGAANGGAIYKDASYLSGRLNAPVASALVNVVDNPHIPRGPSSRAFDGEGLPTKRTQYVTGGVLQSYVLDTYTGRKLGMASTHGARRGLTSTPGPGVSNLWMDNGGQTLEELIAEIDNGLLVTSTFGFGASTVTGDYSQGAVGLWIEDGAIAYPVDELTIASTLDTMFKSIDGIANDRDPRRGVSAPSFRVAQMTVAGR